MHRRQHEAYLLCTALLAWLCAAVVLLTALEMGSLTILLLMLPFLLLSSAMLLIKHTF